MARAINRLLELEFEFEMQQCEQRNLFTDEERIEAARQNIHRTLLNPPHPYRSLSDQEIHEHWLRKEKFK